MKVEIRKNYLNRLIEMKDTEFIKVITGLRRSGKSSLMIMFKEYLIESGINSKNIIYINFETGLYDDIVEYTQLYKYIEDRLENGTNYILLDEVHNVKQWERAVNAMNLNFNVDIYVTGSNAYLLSSEISTLIAGRYLEMKMYPLSFKEYMQFNEYNNKDEAFLEYLKYGGLPAISVLRNNSNLIATYLKDIYNSIVKKDIIDKGQIKDVYLLEKIVKYLSSNVGSVVSTSKISNYLNSNKIVEKSNPQTIENYLKLLEKSFIVYKVNRYDIKGKEILKTLGKYYISDVGIRNIQLGFRNIDEGHILENIIYLELLARGYTVNIGKFMDYEVDFVAQNPDELVYIQVAQSILDENVLNREIRSLESINDNYEKIILTMDKTLNKNIRGIKIINIVDFLSENTN